MIMRSPENMTHEEKLAYIKQLKIADPRPLGDAYFWWFAHCPYISRPAFNSL